MVDAIDRDEQRRDSERSLRDAYADYEVAMKGGDRDGAAVALRRCVEAAEKKAEYRRLLDDLESRIITAGRAALRVRRGVQLIAVSLPRIVMGRDPLCDFPLRSGGISRRHAEIAVEDGDGGISWLLRDAGSRNGTRVGGLPIAGAVRLVAEGSFSLGDECDVSFAVRGERLVLRIARGLDHGTLLVAAPEGAAIALESEAGIPATLVFRSGRPIVMQRSTGLALNGQRIVQADVQLIHGDLLAVGGVEVEVL
jgi:pSer/pThr/pTyr-binding forkhead associated (FHA) protein